MKHTDETTRCVASSELTNAGSRSGRTLLLLPWHWSSPTLLVRPAIAELIRPVFPHVAAAAGLFFPAAVGASKEREHTSVAIFALPRRRRGFGCLFGTYRWIP